MLYFDHNATSPLCPEAREAWLDAVDRYIGNPSSQHRLGQRAEKAIEDARERLAERLGCEAADIVWTSGATEAVNTAVATFAAAADGREAWVSAIEHPCMLESVKHWFPGRFQLIPVTSDGAVDLPWLSDKLAAGARPAFVGIMAANNETGVLQPWKEAATLCATREIPLFSDAAQWVGKLRGEELGHCHAIAGCAHKFGGPQGAGFLVLKGGPRPLLRGGPQESGTRAGTENVAGILAMIAALEAREGCGSGELRDEFEGALLADLPGVQVVGANGPRLWNTSTVLMPEVDCRFRWVVKLDKMGFAVSTGSACASGKERPSHVLTAMGVSPEEAARALRFSAGWETGAKEWRLLREGITQAAAELGCS